MLLENYAKFLHFLKFQPQQGTSSNISCRCGVNSKDTKQLHCIDVEGQRRTKCRCFKKGGCTSRCNCWNCGSRKDTMDDTVDVKTKKTRSPRKKSYQRPRTSKFLKDGGDTLKGVWSDAETITLIVICNHLRKTGLPLTDRHHHALYDLVYIHTSEQELQELAIRRKSLNAISCKLQNIDKHFF